MTTLTDDVVISARGAAIEVALAYFETWSTHDFERALRYVADDVVCDAPAGRLVGKDAFAAFMGPFERIVTSARLLVAAGDDQRALVLYDTKTVPVADAPGAEYVRVRDGRITWMRIVFDRVPFAAAREAGPR